MPEAFLRIRDFLEAGGGVLVVLAIATAVLWTLLIERLWYYRFGHPVEVKHALEAWSRRRDHTSWSANQVRRLLVSEVKLKLDDSLVFLKAVVAVCPLLGLLGTVTGMIEVFEVMAITGGVNPRAMAAGVAKATIPTMAGMVAALSGLVVSARIERFAQAEGERMADRLTPEAAG